MRSPLGSFCRLCQVRAALTPPADRAREHRLLPVCRGGLKSSATLSAGTGQVVCSARWGEVSRLLEWVKSNCCFWNCRRIQIKFGGDGESFDGASSATVLSLVGLGSDACRKAKEQHLLLFFFFVLHSECEAESLLWLAGLLLPLLYVHELCFNELVLFLYVNSHAFLEARLCCTYS